MRILQVWGKQLSELFHYIPDLLLARYFNYIWELKAFRIRSIDQLSLIKHRLHVCSAAAVLTSRCPAAAAEPVRLLRGQTHLRHGAGGPQAAAAAGHPPGLSVGRPCHCGGLLTGCVPG